MNYIPIKSGKCPKCKSVTRQTLFDYNNSLYKCTKCNNIHA